MTLVGFIKDLAQWFSSPRSGTKRRRDESTPNEHDQGRKAPAVRSEEISAAVVDEMKLSQEVIRPAAAEPAPSLVREIVNWQSPAVKSGDFTFDLSERVRELEPLRACADRLPQARFTVKLASANAESLQPGRFSQRTETVGGRRPPPPPSRAQQMRQQPQPQPLGPLLKSDIRMTSHGPNIIPGVDPTLSLDPKGYQRAIPRQLFATPESTQRHFDNLQLGGNTPVAPDGVPASSIIARRLGLEGIGGGSSYHGAPAGTPAAAASIPGPSTRGLTGFKVPGPYRPSSAQDKSVPPSLQQQHQQPQRARLPYYASFASDFRAMISNVRDLGSGKHLKALVQEFEASRAHRPPVVPLREDGGYIPGDDEEENAKTSALAHEARATVDLLRNTLAATVRKANSDPRVAAANGQRQVAQAALEASQAAAEMATVSVVDLKRAAHEQAVKRIKAEVEEETRRMLEAAQAEKAKGRAELAAQQQRFRQSIQLVKPLVAATAAVSTSAAASGPLAAGPVAHPSAARAVPQLAATQRPAAGRAKAAPGKAGIGKPKPPAADEVVELLSSSDDEEEDQEEEEEEKVAAAEDEEADDGDPYSAEYGCYHGEERGGGNSALRLASRAERSTWRRTMDADADPGELIVEFRPNTVLSVELPRAKLQCMDLGVWLNDEVINLYMLLLQARDTRLRQAARRAASAAPRCHFFNSFFYNKLFQDAGAYNYANVRRWTTPKQLTNKLQASSGLLELDRIIVPIHKGVHWTCAEVDLRARAVRYYDSLKGEDHALMRHLLTWVSDESADKLHQRWDTSKWSVEFPKNIPDQRNGCDCGVFSIMFADRRGAGLPFDFSQRDMPLLRIKVLQRVVKMHVD